MSRNAVPPISDVVEVLTEEIATMRRSYKEADGKVRDAVALHAIACLQAARRIVLTAPSTAVPPTSRTSRPS